MKRSAYQARLVAEGSRGRVEPNRLRLAFLVRLTLGRSELTERIARTPRKLLVVLSARGTGRSDDHLCGAPTRCGGAASAGDGHRCSRMVIRIDQDKGGKDRYVMLSPQLLEILRVYWGLTKPGQ